jgi:hypothetical protein
MRPRNPRNATNFSTTRWLKRRIHISSVTYLYGPLFGYHKGLAENYPTVKRWFSTETPTERSRRQWGSGFASFCGFCTRASDLKLLGKFTKWFLHPTEDSESWATHFDDQPIRSYLSPPSAKKVFEQDSDRGIVGSDSLGDININQSSLTKLEEQIVSMRLDCPGP